MTAILQTTLSNSSLSIQIVLYLFKFPKNMFPMDHVVCLFKFIKVVPNGPINKKSSWVKIMAWYQTGYKPLYEPYIVACLFYLLFEKRTWLVNMDLKDNQQCFRLKNWFSFRRVWPWMNHLPPVWWSTFRFTTCLHGVTTAHSVSKRPMPMDN